MNENKVNGVGSVQFRREDKDRVYEVQAMDSTDRDRGERLVSEEKGISERTFISLVALPSSIRFQGRREDIGQPELERKQEHQGPVQESASVKEENPTV
ncbi:hypothetical protein SDJN03_23734, partial [Cucurbita argyrosperma subsp. sororia]